MNNRIKQLFLLPSILLANAYLLVGSPITTNNNDYSQNYSLTVKDNQVKQTELAPNNTQKKEEINSELLIIFFSFLFFTLLFYGFSKKNKNYFIQPFNSTLNVYIKHQENVFYNIKSSSKHNHSKIFRFYSNSLSI